MTRDQLVAAARQWKGTPYVPQQRVLGEGGDCVAMVEWIALKFNIIDKPYRTNYGPEPKMREIIKNLTDAGCIRLRSVNDRQPGDIAFIQYRNTPQHLGIFTDETHLVHGYSLSGEYRETIINSRLLDGLRQVWQYPGID